MTKNTPKVAIIGGGPAGLMAAEALLPASIEVHLFDAMPSLGRKFLMAGKSGLNLTHSEALEPFLTRFGPASPLLAPAIRALDPQALRDWASSLGVETFIGSSGRVFPKDFKAAPLLRAWLKRLRGEGLVTHVRHRWLGWTKGGALLFDTPSGHIEVEADATVLALGGASWPDLGSDARWTSWLEARGIGVAPFRPANCGFDVAWSEHMRTRFAGAPVKSVVLSFEGESHRGEFVIAKSGIEGSGIYALSSALRDALAMKGGASLTLDLAPDRSLERLTADLLRPRKGQSMANFLRKTVAIEGVKAALLRECLPADAFSDPAILAQGIKALPLKLEAARPIAEAISSAGGILLSELDEHFMLRKFPGIFCAGEMLDWEAPTGGYLLTACFATGRAAGLGARAWFEQQD
ncbi:TIGR03862 family flavoprotein [Parvibaculum sedimenti]|uniref:TIGR03862 family flavoprotein n=1 Tax=Parvibaculum sedimenti TaxID=2608632 RepID=UPI0024839BB8|nr:TIGR03862 family flavoprotein [Parvibaculum sedimenti]